MTTLKGAAIVEDFVAILDEYLKTRFGRSGPFDIREGPPL
jgi:hypothetical protein